MLFSFCLLTSDFFLQAQAPQGIPYQAIARNASGVAIASTAVKVRFSIRDSIATSAIKYQETHSPTTSALGLFSVNVGMGTVVSGTFSGINWGKNAKFLQVEMDPAGGSTYTDLGTTQMMSVPYALQANAIKMKTSVTGDTLYTGGGNFVIVSGISASNPILNQPEAPVTDIDGNVYQTVRIGTQVWMKENLKVSRYRNGNPITNNLNDSQWVNSTSGAYAIYNNDLANNEIYGKLYNFFAVKDTRGLCSTGWHVPTVQDWNLLARYLDSAADTTCGFCTTSKLAGGKMKSTGMKEAGSGLWNSPNTGATNSSGFRGFPGGSRYYNGTFYSINNGGFWWTSTGNSLSDADAWTRYLDYSNADLYGYTSYKITGCSVRCLKD